MPMLPMPNHYLLGSKCKIYLHDGPNICKAIGVVNLHCTLAALAKTYTSASVIGNRPHCPMLKGTLIRTNLNALVESNASNGKDDPVQQ